MKNLEEIEIEATAYGQAVFDKFMETEPLWSSEMSATNAYLKKKRQLLKENGFDQSS